MLKKVYFFIMVLTGLLSISCSDNENTVSNEKNGPKPAMDIIVSPQNNLSYGDKINVSGEMTDERNLEQYVLTLTNSTGDTLVVKQQSLLGQSFHINDNLFVPLPKNAKADNLKLEVKLDNTRSGELVQTFDFPSVSIPNFGTLHLLLNTGQAIDLIKNGDVYVTPTENVYPAGVKGIISTTTSKNGIYWGTTNGDISSMAKDSIVIGGDIESSFTVSFNPITFELTTGEKHFWTPLPNNACYYILGTISGHWQDGEITAEKQKMIMKGFESGNDRYYTWTAPDGDNPETGMWGKSNAGIFRLKRGGTGEYILWDGKKIIQSTVDDKNKSFPLTAGGPFTIRANFQNNVCTSVEVAGGGKSVFFGNGKVVVNGSEVKNTAQFNGSNLTLKSGACYVYEGNVKLTHGQTVSSSFDLSAYTANPDLFDGGGNPTWTLKSVSDTYHVRMDIFSGTFYAAPTSAYPNTIYMDGWSWAPTETSPPVVWDADNVLPLVKTAKGTYEGMFYNFGWGGDVAFYVTYPHSGFSVRLPNTNFNSIYVNAAGANGSFTIPKTAGRYKVIVDLKEGINIGADKTVTPKGSAKFTLNYEELK